MRKIVIPSAGGYDKLHIVEDKVIPKPKAGEVLVRTYACGVNYADCVTRMGLYASAKKYVGWPITPGFEFSGTVEEIGPESDSEYESIFKKRGIHVGSKVFGVNRFGAYSTHVVVPKYVQIDYESGFLFLMKDMEKDASYLIIEITRNLADRKASPPSSEALNSITLFRHQLYLVPSNMSMEEAAGFFAVFLTAHYGLFELVHPRKGQTMLVHSAAGGVGSALVQLGKIAGCKVVGVVGSSHKKSIAEEIGADHVIDKSCEPLWKKAEEYAPEGYDSVFDANGVETLGNSYSHLAAGGKLVVYGFHTMLPRTGGIPNWPKIIWDWLWTPRFNPLNMTSENHSVLAFNLSFMFHRTEIMTELADQLVTWIDEGKIRVPKVTTYTLENVAQAHKAIESGQTVGKLVLLT